MLGKIAIRVCPVPGCATISSTPQAICPTHKRVTVREVYVHRRASLDNALDPNFKAALDALFKGVK